MAAQDSEKYDYDIDTSLGRRRHKKKKKKDKKKKKKKVRALRPLLPSCLPFAACVAHPCQRRCAARAPIGWWTCRAPVLVLVLVPVPAACPCRGTTWRADWRRSASAGWVPSIALVLPLLLWLPAPPLMRQPRC